MSGSYSRFSGEVSDERIYLYDHQTQSYISGIHSTPNFALYDYGSQAHIDIDIDGTSFKGLDHKSGCRFHGSVVDPAIALYDYEEGQFFSYTI